MELDDQFESLTSQVVCVVLESVTLLFLGSDGVCRTWDRRSDDVRFGVSREVVREDVALDGL